MAQQHFNSDEFFERAPQGFGAPYPLNFPNYMWNSIILELYNNWPHARWLMYRYQEQMLKQVDPVEKDWIDFILQNNIQILKYEKDNEKFLKEHFRENMGEVTKQWAGKPEPPPQQPS